MEELGRWIVRASVACALLVGVVGTLALAGCGATDVIGTSACAKPPAEPLGIKRTQHALRAEGIQLANNGDCRTSEHQIVALLQTQSDTTSVFCEVDKSPAPRFKGKPQTIFQGPSVTGKAYELALANIDCKVYGDQSVRRAVRRALRSLGGRRTESF